MFILWNLWMKCLGVVLVFLVWFLVGLLVYLLDFVFFLYVFLFLNLIWIVLYLLIFIVFFCNIIFFLVFIIVIGINLLFFLNICVILIFFFKIFLVIESLFFKIVYYNLILMFILDGKFKFIKVLIVFGVGFIILIKCLCVCCLNCLCEFLYLCMVWMIVYIDFLVGNGIGLEIFVLECFVVFIIFFVDWLIMWWL